MFGFVSRVPMAAQPVWLFDDSKNFSLEHIAISQVQCMGNIKAC